MDNTLVKNKKADFKRNHENIVNAYVNEVAKTGKAPSISELERQTSLSRPTIYKHIRSMALSELGDNFKLRALTILEGVAKRAEEGDVPAARLILSVAYGWSEKKIFDVQTTSKSISVTFTNPSKDQMQKIVDENVQETEYVEEDDD